MSRTVKQRGRLRPVLAASRNIAGRCVVVHGRGFSRRAAVITKPVAARL